MDVLREYSEFSYLLSVVFATFIALKYLLVCSSSKQRVGVTTVIGLILGWVWFKYIGASLDLLILSFFAATGFYELIIKVIMKKMEIKYD